MFFSIWYNKCMWITFFILGLIIGSFLNVVILRHNTGHSLAGRSGCMSCSAGLKWWELLPVVSFFALRAKCSSCGSAISWQYPIVEFSLATLFVLVYLQDFNLMYLVLGLIIVTLLLLIAVYDARHTIIPNAYVYSFVLVALLWHLPQILWMPAFDMWAYIAGVLVSGLVLALPFALLWIISAGKWIGLGDSKLMLGVGFMLGLLSGFVALTIGSIVGAVVSLVYLGFYGKQGKIKLEIPYGPFLILGFFAVWLLHIDIWYMQLIGL